ncbi:MAG: hypothetical protein Q8M24_16170 [Pseudolabrys sp.]|nr:hypothetical protein [Pseudolabrys sp.]MDP2296979.1 hypothetical protein [Pseudolabrys sp.]
MKVLDIINRAAVVCVKLPDRTVNAETDRNYRKTFVRMWREPTIDALASNIARSTYYYRRSALHRVSRVWLRRLCAKCLAAGRRNDIQAVQRWTGILLRVLNRIEPALQRDPPVAAGVSPLQSQASRWREAEGSHPKPGARSKKHILRLLPPNWDELVWLTALEEWNEPKDQKVLDTLAVALVVPVRPEEFVPGDRPHGRSEGIVVQLLAPERLHIINATVKNHGGRYGAGVVTVKINPTEAGGPAAYLAARCFAAGGRMVIANGSKNAARKRLYNLGKIALPDNDEAITPFVFRHQVMADLKATLGAGRAVAAAAGHCTDRTQSEYGRVENGRRRRGLIGVDSTRTPRTGNVERARNLASRLRRRGLRKK